MTQCLEQGKCSTNVDFSSFWYCWYCNGSTTVDSNTGSSDSEVYPSSSEDSVLYRNKRCFGQILEMKCLRLLYVLILVVMGNFKGHALPGTFFLILGIWWTTKCILKYAFKKHKRTSYLDSKVLFHRVEILEGIIIAGMALTGEWPFSVFCLLFGVFSHAKRRFNIKTRNC